MLWNLKLEKSFGFVKKYKKLESIYLTMFSKNTNGDVMSGPIQSLADPMSTFNTSARFFQEERSRRDAERRTRVNKEYEKALSSSSSESESECKCKCKCKAEKLTPQQIAYRRDLDRRLAKWEEGSRARWEAFDRKRKEESCTIL